MSSKLTSEQKARVAEATAELLADTYTLYLKTHGFHWNVTGPMFTTLHTLFMTQYNEMWLAVDEIAERIRSLGHMAPGSYAQLGKRAKVQEATDVPSAHDMIVQLADDQDTVVAAARRLFELAEPAGDQASADLAVRRIDVHEKNAWMLRSHLEA